MTIVENQEYENVLVIGNGFDLDLGLPTGYGDFVKSTQFVELLESGSEVAEYLSEKHILQRWIDIENEFPALSKINAHRTDAFFQEYKELCNCLVDYVNSIDYSYFRKNSQAAAVLNSLLANGSTCVINFNYTDSVKLLTENSITPAPSKQIRIHGSAKGRIVFGVQDNAEIRPEHVFLRKSVSPDFYDKWMVGEIMKKASRGVVIFGHSLGATDHTHFLPFFGQSKNSSSSKVDIYYHSEKSYYDIYQQIEIMTGNHIQSFRALHDFKMIGPDIS